MYFSERFIGKPVVIQLSPDRPYTMVVTTPDTKAPLALIARGETDHRNQVVPKGYELLSHLMGKLISLDDGHMVIECASPSDPSKILIIAVQRKDVVTFTVSEDASKLVGVAPDAIGPAPGMMITQVR